ncbi:MAG: prephenate dehydrogenase [Bacteroidota bacterium]
MKVTIIGLGLIGGSMAKDMRKIGFASQITGVDNNPDHCSQALNHKIVDAIATLDKGITNADLIILAIPVLGAQKVIHALLDKIDDRTVVMDVGSTKTGICNEIRDHPSRKNFVATHPMAGTEFSGPDAAIEGLFRQKASIICDREQSSPEAVELVINLYHALGMHTIYMNASDHDVHAAYVSHISHISSFVLSLTVLEKEKSEKAILDMASGGFESTVRLAKSSSEMWSQIFIQNKNPMIEVIDKYSDYLTEFRQAILNDDKTKIETLIQKANEIKKALK